jgi:NADH-quinone oxidoreductase subunit M
MLLFIVPFITALVMFLLPRWQALKTIAIALSCLPLLILIGGGSAWLGAFVRYPWLPALSIEFHLSIDGISLLFLYLVAIIVPISLLATENKEFPQAFYGLILLLQGLMIGFFTIRDLALFTFFWEAMLIPLYFLISFWGGANRQLAALKFLIYMIAGSSLMVAAVLALYLIAGGSTFDFDALSAMAHVAPSWVGAIFLLAFAVKTPLFPFHAWLPDAYYEAPTTGTILLSALLSKAGIYGFIRLGLGFFPSLMQAWSPVLLSLAIIGVFYGGLAAWMQKDYKRLIAYSSFSHVNFILAGLFVWNQTAHSGAILQAINHGITITGLFLVASWLARRIGTTTIDRFSGVAKFLPHLCWLTLVFVLSSVALPGTNNFVGEFMVLLGVFKLHPWAGALLALTVILSVMYMLRWMQLVYFETPNAIFQHWLDIGPKELAIALPLLILIFWIGIYPTPFLKLTEPAPARLETPQ